MRKRYDIFISYRREGGYETAKHLYDLLTRDGYKVSFDLDTLRNGDFDTELLSRIEQCKDFILIVNSNAFERTLDPTFPKEKDWLRCELAYALEKKKNIIPIFLAGTNGFPDGLPSDVAAVVKKNGPQYNRYYFDDFFTRLKKDFLISKANTAFGKIIRNSVFAVGLLLSIFLLVPNFSEIFKNYQMDKSNEGVDATEGIIYYTDYRKLYVGDYVYEDGSFSHILSKDRKACGIVISLKTTAEEIVNGWTHGWVMALYDANGGTPVPWSGPSEKYDYKFIMQDGTDPKLLMSDTQGYLYSYVSLDDTSDYFAISAAKKYNPCIKNSSGWYLPTLAQWQYIFSYMGGSKISFFDNELSYSPAFSDNKFETFHFSPSYYWTSSLESDGRAWVIYLGEGDKKDFLSREEKCRVRAITAI